MRLRHWIYTLPLRLRSLFRRRRVEQELDEELRYHLERQIDELIEKGAKPEEARTAALRALGGLERRKEECRDMRGVRMIEELMQDLRYGLRTLRKSPGFTTVAVLSLALGIGANTAIFSLVDAILLKMLPVRSPEQLVALEAFNSRDDRINFSYPMFERLRDRPQVFTGILAALDGTYEIEMAGDESAARTEHTEVQLVSGEYFQVLGVNAFIGRTLTAADNQTPGAHPVAVLSYGFWQRGFAGDVSVIGKRILLKAQPFTIIGVTPPAFFGESVGRAPDIWAPLMMQPTLDRGQSYLGEANRGWLRIIARLQPGFNEAQARASLAMRLDQIKAEPRDRGTLANGIAKIEPFSGGRGLAGFRNRFSKPLRVLMAVVGLVLLIACANVANLLLARATTRQREVAIRLAIGARRFRLIRQFLTESALLAAAGGAFGLLFAWWGSRFLLVLVSSDATPIPIDVRPNARILGFTIGVSLLTALIFGLAPAIAATKQDVNAALKLTILARPRLSLSRFLVIGQVALSLLLLTGAGLFVRTLRNLSTLDLGFAAESVLQIRINPQASGYTREQLPDLYRRVLERLNSAPGIQSASMAVHGFRTGNSRTCCILVEGYTNRPDEDREIHTNSVTPGYFRTMGMPLLRGRDFTLQEVSSRPGQSPNIAIINGTMARYYFGEANPLGKRFGWGYPPQLNLDTEIIGVVGDVKYGNLREKPPRLIYFPSQGGDLLVVRAAGPGAALPTTIRREIQAVAKNLEISGVSAIPQLRNQALIQERLLAQLSSFFGLLALALACVGLYGVMSYDAVRRTREIGIRMALGAQRAHVIRMVMRETMVLIIFGLIAGFGAALASTHLIVSLLYGLTPNDPLTIGLAGLFLLTVAALAGYLPARRAARVDPMVALRQD
jgi:putative ABC transport system permease protein